MFAGDMLWVVGLEVDPTRDTICESRNTSFDKAVNVERDGSNRNCFVGVRVWLEKTSIQDQKVVC